MVVGQDFLVILIRVNQGLVQVFPQILFTSGVRSRLFPGNKQPGQAC